MVKLGEDGRKCRLDVGKIHDPPGVRVRHAGDMDFYAEGMPVQACTLVPGRHVGQPVRRFDLETLEDVHAES